MNQSALLKRYNEGEKALLSLEGETLAKRSLGEQIKALREEHRVTQKDLAEALCVVNSTISNWENNRRQPSIDELRRIADFFNESLSVFDTVFHEARFVSPHDINPSVYQMVESTPKQHYFFKKMWLVYLAVIVVWYATTFFRAMIMDLVFGLMFFGWLMIGFLFLWRWLFSSSHKKKVALVPATSKLSCHGESNDVSHLNIVILKILTGLSGIITLVLYPLFMGWLSGFNARWLPALVLWSMGVLIYQGLCLRSVLALPRHNQTGISCRLLHSTQIIKYGWLLHSFTWLFFAFIKAIYIDGYGGMYLEFIFFLAMINTLIFASLGYTYANYMAMIVITVEDDAGVQSELVF